MFLNRVVFSTFVLCCAQLIAAPAFEPISVPAELTPPSVQDGHWTKVSSEDLRFSAPQFKLNQGEYEVSLPGTASHQVEWMPELPRVHRVFKVPAGLKPTVRVEIDQVEATTEGLVMKFLPQTFTWTEGTDFAPPGQDRYFPGSFVRSNWVGDELHVDIFPLQLDQHTGKLVRLVSGSLSVLFDPIEEFVFGENAQKLPAGTQSVILVSESLQKAAALLKDFHKKTLNMDSVVVTVESIEKNFKAIDEANLPNGYKDRNLADRYITAYDAATGEGYHYERARKILSFLEPLKKPGSTLKYVTLVGDADTIPPSYYFSLRVGHGVQFGVTDQCYAANDQCMTPVLAVGRLPVHSEADMENYLGKVDTWLRHVETPKHEVSLFGGKAFPVDLYIGELGTLRLINSQKANWTGVKKYFRTGGNYSRREVLDLVKGQLDTSFIYYLDHGSGNRWHVEDEAVSAKEILKLPAGKLPPFVASIACTNAAFDSELMVESPLGDSMYGDVSVGEALLLSKSGSVAYLGSARPAMGAPIYKFDAHGNLDLQNTNYGLLYIDTFYKKYHDAGRGRAGDFVLAALKAYVAEQGNDMKSDRNLYTYLNVAFLGDPVLSLPERRTRAAAYDLAASSTAFVPSVRTAFPEFLLTAGKTLSLDFESMAEVVATLFKVERASYYERTETAIQKGAYKTGRSSMIVKPSGSEQNHLHFIRIENQQGVPVERQVWFNLREVAKAEEAEEAGPVFPFVN